MKATHLQWKAFLHLTEWCNSSEGRWEICWSTRFRGSCLKGRLNSQHPRTKSKKTPYLPSIVRISPFSNKTLHIIKTWNSLHVFVISWMTDFKPQNRAFLVFLEVYRDGRFGGHDQNDVSDFFLRFNSESWFPEKNTTNF